MVTPIRSDSRIAPEDLDPSDLELAQRIIAEARSYAPCLHSLPPPLRLEAISVLKGVLQEARPRQSRAISSQGVGSARVSYRTSDWFTAGDRMSLRGICREASGESGLSLAPAGSFPLPDEKMGRLWPEEVDE